METYSMVKSKLYQSLNQILVPKTKLFKILFSWDMDSENLSANQINKYKDKLRWITRIVQSY